MKNKSNSNSRISLNKNSSKKMSVFSKENNRDNFNLNYKNIGVVNVNQISEFITKLSLEEIAEFTEIDKSIEDEENEKEGSEVEDSFSDISNNVIK